MTTRTYHDNPDLKDRVVRAAEDHREADRFVQGEYLAIGDGEWRGCSVGCTVAPLLVAERGTTYWRLEATFTSWHEEEARILGIPEWLARVQDTIFEGLGDDHTEWTPRLLSAIPVGVSHEALGAVRDEWLRDLLHDPDRGAVSAGARSLRRAGQNDSASDLERITRETPLGEVRRRCYAAAYDATYACAAAYDATYACDAAVGVTDTDAAASIAADYAANAANAAAVHADDAAWWTWAGDRLIHRLTDTGADQ